MTVKQCILCGADYKCKKYLLNRRKFCSSTCYHNSSKGNSPWNKGKKWSKRVLKGKIISCVICGIDKYYEPNQLRNWACKYCSPQCAGERLKKHKLKYSSIHSRIRKEWGKPQKCIVCETKLNVDWANKSGEYKLDRNDWLELCRKHHIAYDKGRLLI